MGLVAVILGIFGVVRAGKPEVGGKGKGMAIAGIVLGAVGCVAVLFALPMVAVLLPSLNRARETANRVQCASHLRQIGQAMMLYANENNGKFPDSPDKLVTDESLPLTAFLCPSTTDTPAPNAAGLTSGGHDSYVYLGKGLTSGVGGHAVLAYEATSNHGGTGSNFLFGDGHVAFVPAAAATQMIAQLQSGQNPPTAARGF
jgi:prepilin-type processing-associated H-X9-DG protein